MSGKAVFRAPAELRSSPRSRPAGRASCAVSPAAPLRSTGAGAALQLAPVTDAPDPIPAFAGPPEALLEQAAENSRAYRIEVRPGFTEGQYLGLALRMWGKGHWCEQDGQPHHYTERLHAQRAALRWMESGR